MGYSLLINANARRLQGRPNRAGEVLAVNEYDFEYGLDEVKLFTVVRVKSDETPDSVLDFYLKDGIPDAVRAKYDADMAAHMIAVNERKAKGEKFDDLIRPLPIDASLYPTRLNYVDLDTLKLDHPEVIDHLTAQADYEAKLDAVKVEASLSARDAVLIELEAQQSTLVENFDSLTTNQIVDNVVRLDKTLDAGKVDLTADEKKDALLAASRVGRKQIEDAEAAKVTFIEEILTDEATISKADKPL